jgi:hypothetical protein
VARCWAGFASLGAGLVHAAVVGEHPAVEAVFFAVLAAGQLGWGVAALARDRAPVPRWVAGATVAVIALWVLSRTVGLGAVDLGAAGLGAVESVGAADLGAAVLEVLVLVSLASARWGALRARRASAPVLLGGLAAGALLVGAVTTPALAGTTAGAHAMPHGHHASMSHGIG